VDRKLSPEQIASEVDKAMPGGLRERWVWITGGEPYDRDLHELLRWFRIHNFSIAVATSGVHRAIEPVDWLSVSPHDYELVQRFGAEIKLVEGLNGMDLELWLAENPDDTLDFFMRYVQPMSEAIPDHRNPDGTFYEDVASYASCMKFLERHPNWSLSRQDHHRWNLP
jgi:organic radical activating enzyme